MKIKANIQNSQGQHQVTLTTNDNSHSIIIPPKSSRLGSSANGGELLFLALATCYCNDIYREAAKRNIPVEKVEVEVSGEFGAEGEGAKNVSYSAKVHAKGIRRRNPRVDGIHRHCRRNSEYTPSRNGCQIKRG